MVWQDGVAGAQPWGARREESRWSSAPEPGVLVLLHGVQSPVLGHSAVTAVQHGTSGEQGCPLIILYLRCHLLGKFLYLEVEFFPRVFSKDLVVSVMNPGTLGNTRSRRIRSVGKVEQ